MNNLHIITLYKLHNKVAGHACRARRVECVECVRQTRHNQNAWAWHVERVESCRVDSLDTSNVLSRVETWRARWNLGLRVHHRMLDVDNH